MLGTSLVGGKGKRSAASSAAPTSRAMVPWEQEVTDEQGRRRFHGAFTGGFSAGYYNTVGSEEGWTPSTFKSSRGGAGGGGRGGGAGGAGGGGERGARHAQRPQDFMDAEDDPLMGRELTARNDYDTLGRRGREMASRYAREEAEGRGSGGSGGGGGGARGAIPGAMPDELVVPMGGDSIGKRLLRTMGWREGQAVGVPRRRKSKARWMAQQEEDERARGRGGGGSGGGGTGAGAAGAGARGAASSSSSSSSSSSLPSLSSSSSTGGATAAAAAMVGKDDFYGIGFDPHADAPEFRRSSAEGGGGIGKPVTIGQSLGANGGKGGGARGGGAFGLGAYEADEDAEVYHADAMDGYDIDIDARAAAARRALEGRGGGRSTGRGTRGDGGSGGSSSLPIRLCADGLAPLPGFHVAKPADATGKSSSSKKWYAPPTVPRDFRGRHVFRESLGEEMAETMAAAAAAAAVVGAVAMAAILSEGAAAAGS